MEENKWKKNGDAGMTDLPLGRRVRKDDARIRAFAAIDEASCSLGLARAFLNETDDGKKNAATARQLYCIQDYLRYAAAHAGGIASDAKLKEGILFLESAIDELDSHLKPAGGFVTPGSNRAEALLHCARARCRTAETVAVSLDNRLLTRFLNRLSKYLFSAARYHE